MIRLVGAVMFFLCTWCISFSVFSQKLEITTPGGFKNCVEGDDSEFPLYITNNSDKAAFKDNTFSLDWGDGSKELVNVSFEALNTFHLYTKWGVYILKVSAELKNESRRIEKTYQVINLSKPAVGFEKGLSGIPCVNTEAEIFVTNYDVNSNQTVYTLDFGDGKHQKYSQQELMASGGKVTHFYDKTHCDLGHPEGITVRVTAKNECDFESIMAYENYIIIQPPKADFTYENKPGCTGKEIQFINNTKKGLGKNCAPLNLKYEWDFGKTGIGRGQETEKSPVVTYDEKGTYQVTLKIRNSNGFKCANTEKTLPVKIIESVKAGFDVPLIASCAPINALVFTDRSSGDERKYQWNIRQQGIGGGSSSVGSLQQADAKINFNYGTYTVTQQVRNSCSSDIKDTLIFAAKDPEIVNFGQLPDLCPNEILNLSTQYIRYNWYNNGHRLQWNIEPLTGWAVQLGTSLTSEHPRIKFTQPGKYTISVNLEGANCGGTRLTATRTLEVYDPFLNIDKLVADKLDLCEGETVTVRGKPEGITRDVFWEVKTQAGGATDIIPVVKEGETRVTFPKYGKYRITVRVNGACNYLTKNFDVVVHRPPEIILNDFPDYYCPDNEFYPGDYVVFNRDGDEVTDVKWEVTSGGLPTDQVTIIGANTLEPKMKFFSYGDYEIKVTLINPPACSPTEKLTASKILHVVNPQLDVEVQIDQQQICIGEKLTFTNKTTATVKPEYSWAISPGISGEAYEYVDGTNASHPSPHIRFLKSDIYNVSVYVKGVCGGQLVPFSVIVKQDPAVTIDKIDPICPDQPLILSEEIVHYTWNDEWNGGSGNLRKVEWSLLSTPRNADYTPYTSPEWNKLYPELNLKTPGDYVLQAKLISAAGCGAVLTATQNIKVYDPAINVDIEPLLDDIVKDLGGGVFQSLQRSAVKFQNRSTGVGLSYRWTVMPEKGCVIPDKTAAEPVITFEEQGTYRVKVAINGICTTVYKEFTFVVRGVPTLTLDNLADRCDHWDEPLDINRELLHCDSAGNSNIACHWAIQPATGWSFTGSSESDMFVKIRFYQAGVYTLTLSAQGSYGGVQTVSRKIRILSHEIKAKALLSQTSGCTTDDKDGLALRLTNVSQGDSLRYHWRVIPENGWTSDLTQKDPTLVFTGKGDYKVYLQAENICGAQEEIYDFRAFAKPEVESLTGTDLGRQCEREYYFKGEDYVGTIQDNHDALNYVHWSISPEGATFINGLTEEDERPDIKFTGGKSYRIVGKFANHCKDTAKIEYTLWVDEFKKVNLVQQEALCAMSAPVLLQGTPEGGKWSLEEGYENMLKQKDEKYYFSPGRNEEVVVWAYYDYGNGTCSDRDSVKIKVRQLPVVEAGPDQGCCLNAGVQELKGITPLDAVTWKGSGVKNQKWFDPRETGAGIFRLEYHYTDPVTGCSNLDTIAMSVYDLPDPSFTASGQQCRETDSLYTPVELGQGHHFSWDFGNGEVRETEDVAVKYRYPEAGEYQIVLTATSVHQCKNVGEPKTVKVLHLPPAAEFSIVDTAGCGPFRAIPIVDSNHFAGEYYDLRYLWDFGNGDYSTDLQPTARVYPAALFDTTYQMIFKVYNACGQRMDTAAIGVWSKTMARFAMNPEEEGCTPLEVLFMNKSTGSGNKYIWDFGDGSTSTAIDSTHVFTTGASMSVYSVKLTAMNRCTPEGTSFERAIKVKPNTIIAGFTKSKKYLCAGDTVCFENNSVDRDPAAALNYSWEFGDGQVASVWDTCHQYSDPGAYNVKLKVDNGCAHKEFNDSVFVHILPVLKLEGDDALCEDVELELRLSSSEELKNIVWDFGDTTGTEEGLFQVKHVFREPGIYEVKVRGEANQIPSCPGETSQKIEVWSNPRVKIEPLDTMACPPLLYRPQVTATSYDYFTWDYGDGSALTSEMEHLYKNDSNLILSYPLTAYVENNYGCKEEHHGLVRIYNAPKAALDKKISFGRPEEVQFINLSRDYTDCFWYLPFGEIINSPENQTVIFDNEGVYPLSLAVVNLFGCRDSLYLDYRSYEGGLYFPNTFIPHSTNPEVNCFKGVGMGLKEYKLEIFDLYGNKIWETRALEDGKPSEGWDGRNRNGKLLPQGVYMWRAEAIFFSEDVWTGKNNRSGKSQTTQGTVLLLRK